MTHYAHLIILAIHFGGINPGLWYMGLDLFNKIGLITGIDRLRWVQWQIFKIP